MKHSGGIGRNMLVSLVGYVFVPLSGLLLAPVLAHSLKVDGRGQLASAMGPYLLLTITAGLGVTEAVTFTISRHPSVARRVTGSGLGLVFLFGLCATVMAFIVGHWLSGGRAETRQLIELASIAIAPALCVGVVRGTASALHLWKLVSAERLGGAVITLSVVGILALSSHLTPFSATIAMVASPLAGSVVYLRLIPILEVGDNPRTAPFRSSLMGYGLRAWVGGVAGILLMRVDQALMTPLTGVYELGLYVVAVNIAELPLIINGAIRDVMFASEAAGSSSHEVLPSAARISTSLCAGAALGLGLLSPIIVPMLFGHEFSGAVLPTVILLIGAIVGTPGSIAGAGLSGRGRPGLRSLCLAGACAIDVLVLVVLAPSQGALGAAWAMFAGSVFLTGSSLVLMQKHFEVSAVSFLGLRRSDIRRVMAARHSSRRLGGPEGLPVEN